MPALPRSSTAPYFDPMPILLTLFLSLGPILTNFDRFLSVCPPHLFLVHLALSVSFLYPRAPLAGIHHLIKPSPSRLSSGLLELSEFSRLFDDLRTFNESGTAQLALQEQLPLPQEPQHYSGEEAMALARLAVGEAMQAEAAQRSLPPL